MAGAHLWLLKKWFCVLMVLSACCAVSVPRNDDAMVTCETTSSALGETGQVTCHFPADVSSLLPAAITIEKYSNTDQKAEPVLDCKWYEGGDIQCATKEGYELHGPVERQLYLNITVMAQAHAGRYLCKIMTPIMIIDDDDHVCDLKILPAKKPVPTEEATTTAAAFGVGEESDAQSGPETDVSAADSSVTVIIGAAVGGVVFIAFIVLLVVFLVRRRRRSNAESGSGSAKPTDVEDPHSPGLPERDYEPKDQSRTPLLPKTDDVNNENDAGLTGPPKPPRTMERKHPTTDQTDLGNDESNRNNDVGALDDKAAPADVKAQNDDALNSKTGLANAPKAAPVDAKTPNDDKAREEKTSPDDAKPQTDKDAPNGKTALTKAQTTALANAKTPNDNKTALADREAQNDDKTHDDDNTGDNDDVFDDDSDEAREAASRARSQSALESQIKEAAERIDGRARERIMSDDYPFLTDDMRVAARERERQSTWGTAPEEESTTADPTDHAAKRHFDPAKIHGTYNYTPLLSSSPPTQS